MDDFVISSNYQGYVFMGCALGKFDTEDGQSRAYYQMFVISPVSDFKSENYSAFGFKAEKKSCISPDVWKGFQPGDRVKLFFDDKKRVVMAALDE